jgi:glycosyltransferase involved in cell wall biosynthesis
MQVDRSKFDVHFFASAPFRDIHPSISDLTFYQSGAENFIGGREIVFFNTSPPLIFLKNLIGTRLTERVIRKIGYAGFQKKALKKTIQKVRPHIIHTMETQHAGYLMSKAFHAGSYAWIHSTWGIDLHYYSKITSHRQQIQILLSKISFLITEGKRDITLAVEMGYNGKTAIIPSVGGAFDFNLLDSLSQHISPSKRKKILLKGYEGFERSAAMALAALRRIREQLSGFEVIVYSCNESLLPLINEIQKQNEFKISSSRELSHYELLQLTSAARISITNNLSDGVPNTMLEAMAFGTFPIQSDTAITDEWIKDGFNGILTNPRDPNNIAAAIQKALRDDQLVDEAAIYNEALIRKRLDESVIRPEIENIYRTVAEERKTNHHS